MQFRIYDMHLTGSVVFNEFLMDIRVILLLLFFFILYTECNTIQFSRSIHRTY